ncbi:MAG: acetyl-CoA carboxylase biotin carboxyl carrier protein, partial [Succinivibrionaceae bacterium]|nr:acetyl-CoA carboxylase biotin carboxyl carrier protein [Succinivibrionaceae bacterium]
MQIDIHKISKLIELVSKSDISEICLKQDSEEIKITRNSAPLAGAPVERVVAIAPSAAPAAVA